MCQQSIKNFELLEAEKIFLDFIHDYQRIYGTAAMSFNLHGHLHLFEQIRRFGPLPKCSGFAFENMFRITREMFKGTRNYEGQIGRNLIRKQSIKIDNIKNSSTDWAIKEFLAQNFSNIKDKDNSLLYPKQLMIKNLEPHESALLISLPQDTPIHKSHSAIINSKSEYNFFD